MFDLGIEYHDTYKPALDEADWTLQDMVLGGLAAVGFVILGNVLIVFLLQVVLRDYYLALYAPAVVINYFLRIPALLPIWWSGPSKYGGDWRRLGLLKCDLGRGALLAVGGGVLIWGINTIVPYVSPNTERLGHLNAAPVLNSPSMVFWSVLLCAFLLPLIEEVVFRGFIYAGLRNRWGVRWAIAATAVLFALIFLPTSAFIPTLLIGAILTGMYEMSGSLWPGLAARAVLNIIAIAVAY
jgi:membrane protease YdiL (CAAX protease family)